MAAGRVVDLTRREDINFSSRNRGHCKNGYPDLGYSRNYDRNSISRNGWKGVDGNRSKRTYNSEISRSEDEGPIPATKRSRLLPTREDKEVRIISKNRIVKKSTTRLSSPRQPKSGGMLDCVLIDILSKKVLGTDQHQGKSISSAESCLDDGSESYFESEALANSPYLLSSEFQSKDSVGGEGTEIRKISKSRWAYEEDSPLQRCTSNDGSNSSSKRMEVDTPESGEFRVDISENNTSGSDCLDEVDSDGSFESRLGSEVEDSDDAPEPRSVNMLQACRSVCMYEKLGKISEGTYGIVYKAKDKETGEIVALKKVKKMEREEGFPLTALREINLLLALHHSSIIDVKEVVMDGDSDVYMVMEYMEYDLMKLMKVMKQPFTEKEVKCLMLQLLEGIKDLHDNWILHRDLKTSNILISKNGKLKICDFGMSRQYGSPLKPLTPLVVTLWYRAPELLLGAKKYSTAVDMWSVGCIMAELLVKKLLFDGDSEVRQLDKIYGILGTPTLMTWPGLADLPGYKATFAYQPRNKLREKFPALSFNGSPVLSERGFDLLRHLLTCDPEKRISVDEALAHGWFDLESKQELRFAQESLAQKIKTLAYGY